MVRPDHVGSKKFPVLIYMWQTVLSFVSAHFLIEPLSVKPTINACKLSTQANWFVLCKVYYAYVDLAFTVALAECTTLLLNLVYTRQTAMHKKSKSSHSKPRGRHWSVSLALSQSPAYKLQDHRYRASVWLYAPVYSPAFTSTHCVYLRRDGQAELIWVADYLPR